MITSDIDPGFSKKYLSLVVAESMGHVPTLFQFENWNLIESSFTRNISNGTKLQKLQCRTCRASLPLLISAIIFRPFLNCLRFGSQKGVASHLVHLPPPESAS